MKLENVRLSFPDIFTPTQFNGQGEASYRCQLLVPADSALKKAIDAEIVRVATAKWGAKAKAVLNANEGVPNKTCWLDGAKRAYDGYEGMWALSASRPEKKGPPLRYDRQKALLDKDSGVLYAGCYVHASVNFWTQDNQHGKAVRCELLGVQFFADGDAFGGGSKPDPDDFDDISEGADASADLA
jgi:hypothetical protein